MVEGDGVVGFVGVGEEEGEVGFEVLYGALDFAEFGDYACSPVADVCVYGEAVEGFSYSRDEVGVLDRCGGWFGGGGFGLGFGLGFLGRVGGGGGVVSSHGREGELATRSHGLTSKSRAKARCTAAE